MAAGLAVSVAVDNRLPVKSVNDGNHSRADSSGRFHDIFGGAMHPLFAAIMASMYGESQQLLLEEYSYGVSE